MRVDVYKEDTATALGKCLWLGDVLGDDEAAMTEAARELKTAGRYWYGGGAQPLVYIVPAGAPAHGWTANV